QLSGFDRRKLDHGEKIVSTPWRRRGIDDDAAGLIAESGREDARGGRHGVLVDVEREQALLEAAQVLRASDDLLPRVTPLPEIEAVQQVPVRGLCDQLVR